MSMFWDVTTWLFISLQVNMNYHFCYGIVDETWIHYYMLETKILSKMLTGRGICPEKSTVSLGGKATIFCDLQKGKTIHERFKSHYWFNLMLYERKNGLNWQKSGFPTTTKYHWHCSVELLELHYEILPCIPNSPDLSYSFIAVS